MQCVEIELKKKNLSHSFGITHNLCPMKYYSIMKYSNVCTFFKYEREYWEDEFLIFIWHFLTLYKIIPYCNFIHVFHPNPYISIVSKRNQCKRIPSIFVVFAKEGSFFRRKNVSIKTFYLRISFFRFANCKNIRLIFFFAFVKFACISVGPLDNHWI